MAFAITVSPAITGHRWVGIEGPVDAGTAADVREMVRIALSDRPTRRLTVDLTRARIGDEAGRRVLAEVAELARARGVELSTVDALTREGGPGASVGAGPAPAAGAATEPGATTLAAPAPTSGDAPLAAGCDAPLVAAGAD